jgi:hypothetical protein
MACAEATTGKCLLCDHEEDEEPSHEEEESSK